MQQDLGTIVLKNGERVEAAVIAAPDAAWADRLKGFLAHKGELWNWGNAENLTKLTGVETFFYVLHREGVPFSNIMTSEVKGVGHFGHVFTRLEDRRKGACDKLMTLQMEHFRARGGRALFLGTGFGSPAYRIYACHGFQGIEDESGYMEYYATTREEFEASWFARAAVEIEPLAMAHWPVLAPLLVGGFQGRVRCARLGSIGRSPGESQILKALYEDRHPVEGKEPRSLVLRNRQSGAGVGFATCGSHPIWAELCLADVFCHPDFWDGAGELLASLPLPPGSRCIAYADVGWTGKDHVLRRAGFRQTGVLARRAPQNSAKTAFVDVAVYEKET
ncbi:MAG: GNAT family N-acetyltransferase [Candidatus Brocadiia bacterium]